MAYVDERMSEGAPPRPRRSYSRRPDYIPVTKPWTWESGTPRERANSIRNHVRYLPDLQSLAKLFRLTPRGLRKILDGDDWRPRYAADDNA